MSILDHTNHPLHFEAIDIEYPGLSKNSLVPYAITLLNVVRDCFMFYCVLYIVYTGNIFVLFALVYICLLSNLTVSQVFYLA